MNETLENHINELMERKMKYQNAIKAIDKELVILSKNHGLVITLDSKKEQLEIDRSREQG